MPVPSGRDARWRAGLAVGALLDAQDSAKKWFDSKIVEVDAPTDRVKVHYRGWADKWDS